MLFGKATDAIWGDHFFKKVHQGFNTKSITCAVDGAVAAQRGSEP